MIEKDLPAAESDRIRDASLKTGTTPKLTWTTPELTVLAAQDADAFAAFTEDGGAQVS